MWHKELWLIDHGAALYFHHSWQNWQEQAQRPFIQIKDHVLLPNASLLTEVNAEFRERLANGVIPAVVSLIPNDWLSVDSPFESADEHRQAYISYLQARLSASEIFVKGAQDAR
ncbi:hypothetical protein D3C86_1954050 [compost metagenome]